MGVDRPCRRLSVHFATLWDGFAGLVWTVFYFRDGERTQPSLRRCAHSQAGCEGRPRLRWPPPLTFDRAPLGLGPVI